MSNIYGKSHSFGSKTKPYTQIMATFPSGTTNITLTGNGKQWIADYESSTYNIYLVTDIGYTYTLSGQKDGKSKSINITVSESSQNIEIELQFGIPLSELIVGDRVYLDVNNVSTEFIIVHQGRPTSSYSYDTVYSTTFDNGTILLMKDCYTKMTWGSNNDYENSNIHPYLNTTFISFFNQETQNLIKQVKIPYRPGNDGKKENDGENGLTAKVFLLSAGEVSYDKDDNYVAWCGLVLDYFNIPLYTSLKERRIAYLNGNEVGWYTRSPSTLFGKYMLEAIGEEGGQGHEYASGSLAIRPALVLPNTAIVDDAHKIIV